MFLHSSFDTHWLRLYLFWNISRELTVRSSDLFRAFQCSNISRSNGGLPLLMEEIPNNHLGCRKHCKYGGKLPINWCRISSMNSMTVGYVEFYFSQTWRDFGHVPTATGWNGHGDPIRLQWEDVTCEANILIPDVVFRRWPRRTDLLKDHIFNRYNRKSPFFQKGVYTYINILYISSFMVAFPLSCYFSSQASL